MHSNAEITIRPAAAGDCEAVLNLFDELFEPPGRRPPDYTRERAARNFRRYVESEDGDVLVAVSGDEVIGLASVYVDIPSIRFGQRCWLEDLVVTSSQRSRGVGRLLLDAATGWARARDCTHLELDSGLARKDAHRFYEANGMTGDGLVFGKAIEPEGGPSSAA